jgi:threonine/homoserine efflux transporter RhtA
VALDHHSHHVRYIRQLAWIALAILGIVAVLRVTPQERALALVSYFGLVAFALAAWVIYDARRLELRKYQTSLAWHPVLVFILVACFPFVVFPWYLTVRERVLEGQVPRKRQVARGSAIT